MEIKTNIHTLMNMANDGRGMPDYIVAAIERATHDCGEFCNRMETTPEIAEEIARMLVMATVPANPRMEPYPAFELQVYSEILRSAIEADLLEVTPEYMDVLDKVTALMQGQVFTKTNQEGFSIEINAKENSPLEQAGLLPMFEAMEEALRECEEKEETVPSSTIGQYPIPNHPMVGGAKPRELIYSLN